MSDTRIQNTTLAGPIVFHGNVLKKHAELSNIVNIGNTKRGFSLDCTADGTVVVSGSYLSNSTHQLYPPQTNVNIGFNLDNNDGSLSNNSLKNTSYVKVLRLYNSGGTKMQLTINGYAENLLSAPPTVIISGVFADNTYRTHTFTATQLIGTASTDLERTYMTYIFNSTLLPSYVNNNSVLFKTNETYNITIKTKKFVEVIDVIGERLTQVTDIIDQENNQSFGQSVSISDDGLRLVIGAPQEEISSTVGAGAVYIYEKTTGWDQVSQLTDDDTIEADDNFGKCVAISGDGNTIAIGEPNRRDGGIKRGLVHVYRWDGMSWSRVDSFSPTLSDNALFGTHIDISEDGFCIAVGAPSDGDGKIFMYEEDVVDTWSLKDTISCPNTGSYDFGGKNSFAISADGERLSVGAEKMYVYDRELAGTWIGKPLPLPKLPNFSPITLQYPKTFIAATISGNGNVISGSSPRNSVVATNMLSGITTDTVNIEMVAGHLASVNPDITSQTIIVGHLAPNQYHTYSSVIPSSVSSLHIGSTSQYSLYNSKSTTLSNTAIDFVIHNVNAQEDLLESITIHGMFGYITATNTTSTRFLPSTIISEGVNRTITLYPSVNNSGNDSLPDTNIEYLFSKKTSSDPEHRNSSVWRWNFYDTTSSSKKSNVFIPSNTYSIIVKLKNVSQNICYTFEKENDSWKIKDQQVANNIYQYDSNTLGYSMAMDTTGTSLFLADTTTNAIFHYNNTTYSPTVSIGSYVGNGTYPRTISVGNNCDVAFILRNDVGSDLYFVDTIRKNQTGDNVLVNFSMGNAVGKESTFTDITLDENRTLQLNNIPSGPTYNLIDAMYNTFSLNSNPDEGLGVIPYVGTLTLGYQFIIVDVPNGTHKLYHRNLDDGLLPSTASSSTLSPLSNRGNIIRTISSGEHTYNTTLYADVTILEIYGDYIDTPLESFKIMGVFSDGLFKTISFSHEPIYITLSTDSHGQYTTIAWDNTSLTGYTGVSFSRMTSGKYTLDIDGENVLAEDEIPHNMPSTPEMIMIKNRDTDSHWYIWHKDLPTNSYLTQQTSIPIQLNSSINQPDLTHIPMILDDKLNFTLNFKNDRFISYIFSSSSTIDVGVYVGNSTTTVLSTVNSPAIMLVKNITEANPWNLFYRVGEYNNFAYVSNITTGSAPSLSSTFFGDNTVNIVGSSSSYNKIGNSYIYVVISNAYIP